MWRTLLSKQRTSTFGSNNWGKCEGKKTEQHRNTLQETEHETGLLLLYCLNHKYISTSDVNLFKNLY